MPNKPLKKDVPQGFRGPTALPKTPEESTLWQDANRSWWEAHPMRYDWLQKVGHKEFSPEFYREIDSRFFSTAKAYLPWKKIPFDALVDFESLKTKDVLEIGVGNGSHAQLLAAHARSFTGIDITDYAVRSTTERFRHFGLRGTILRMDAERMPFQEGSFDLIWSWGVIHLSSNTRRILEEMHRVLKPGSRAVTMVYYRNFWSYYVMGGLFRGILQGDLLRTKSLHKTVQRWTDGAFARFYTVPEWRAQTSDLFELERVLICGQKAEIVPLPPGPFKEFVMRLIPDGVSRFLTNRCRLGNFLVSTLHKR